MIEWKANDKMNNSLCPWMRPSEMDPLVICLTGIPDVMSFWHFRALGGTWTDWPFTPLSSELNTELVRPNLSWMSNENKDE